MAHILGGRRAVSDGNGKRLDEALNSKLALIAARVVGPILLTAIFTLMVWELGAISRLEVAVARLEMGAAGIDRRLTIIENRR